MSHGIGQIANGMKYFSVQVRCSNGVEYGIPAYGDEAEELYKVAAQDGRKRVPITPIARR